MTLRPALAALVLTVTPALAETAYLDDRSTPEAVVRSLYNAINRHELVRAWSYWKGSADEPVFRAFSNGYAATDHVDLVLGKAVSEGAAGSVYYSLPVAIRAMDGSGKAQVFAGCYTLRQVNPALQDIPPFRPIHIETGDLRPAIGELAAVVPEGCE